MNPAAHSDIILYRRPDGYIDLDGPWRFAAAFVRFAQATAIRLHENEIYHPEFRDFDPENPDCPHPGHS